MKRPSDTGYRTLLRRFLITAAFLALTALLASSSFSGPSSQKTSAPSSCSANEGKGCGSDPAGNMHKQATWKKLYRLTDAIEAARIYYARQYKKPLMMSRRPKVEGENVRIFVGSKNKTSRILLVDSRYRVSETPVKVAKAKK